MDIHRGAHDGYLGSRRSTKTESFCRLLKEHLKKLSQRQWSCDPILQWRFTLLKGSGRISVSPPGGYEGGNEGSWPSPSGSQGSRSTARGDRRAWPRHPAAVSGRSRLSRNEM